MEKIPSTINNSEARKENDAHPWFYDVPQEEYIRTRLRILRDEGLDTDEKIEMLRNCDAQRADLVLQDQKQYSEYMRDRSFTSMENALQKHAAEEVVDSFTKKDGYYNLQENSTVIIPEKFAVYGISGEVTFDRITVSETGTRTFSFRIHREKERGFGEEEYIGSMSVDVASGSIKTVVLPESIDLVDPNQYINQKQSLSSMLALPQIALSSVTRIPNVTPVSYQDGRADNMKNHPENKPTALYEEITSTLLYRRCTIKPGQPTDRIRDEINKMLDNIPDEHRVILKQIGNGQIRFRIYFARRVPKADTGISLFYSEPTVTPAADIGELVGMLEQQFADGAIQAIVIPEGSRVPRELENLPPGPSPRHHTRRTRTKVVVVLGGDTPDDIRKIQTLISTGGSISEKQLRDMATYTGLDLEIVRNAWQVNHRRITNKTIITSDAKPVSEKRSVTNIPHRYKKAY